MPSPVGQLHGFPLSPRPEVQRPVLPVEEPVLRRLAEGYFSTFLRGLGDNFPVPPHHNCAVQGPQPGGDARLPQGDDLPNRPGQGDGPVGQPLKGDPGTEHEPPKNLLRVFARPGPGPLQMEFQQGGGGVPQIFVRQALHQCHPQGIAVLVQKCVNFLKVASGLQQQLPLLRMSLQLFPVAVPGHAHRPFGGACRQHRRPRFPLLCVQRRGVDGSIMGGTEIERCPVQAGEGGGQFRPILGLTVTEGLPRSGRQVEIPNPQLHPHKSVRSGGEVSDGAEPGFVEYFQCDGFPRLGPEGVCLCVGVAGGLIVIQGLALPTQGSSMEGGVAHRAEGAAMNQHGPGGGGVEPAPIQHRLRLTRAQEPPFTVAQNLHPGVVVVTVRPPGGVYLSGRQAHRAQGGHQEGGLLPAPAAATAIHRQGGGGAVVLSLVAGLLMAPAIDLQNGFLLLQVLHPLPQLTVKQSPVVG